MAGPFSFHPAPARGIPALPKINSSFTAKIRNPGPDRLLDYLARRFTYHSPAEWADLLAKDRLELEGKVARGAEPLREGMELRFAVVDYDEPEVPLDYRILERDKRLAFVHKPAGMPVHRTGKIFFQTLANLVKEELGDPAWAPLNRLDRETSGLVAFARGPDAFRELAPSSEHSRWTKFYTAVVRGEPPAAGGRIEVPLGEKSDGAIRCQMHAMPHGKPALTLYRKIAFRDGLSLLALSPITGRKHQLRAHLAEIGCPVVGDKIYSLGGRAYLKQLDADLDSADHAALGATRHLLHSFCLRIGSVSGTALGSAGSVTGPASEAWDWDVGPEFARVFKALEVRTWCATPAFGEFWAEAEAARNGMQA
ncbi:MAG: putative pseudouridine synthase, RluD family [Fibrobacteres bacterium]|nr:putative pseudouridine synthase, RluD family [Fibrobacterota bacterium]